MLRNLNSIMLLIAILLNVTACTSASPIDDALMAACTEIETPSIATQEPEKPIRNLEPTPAPTPTPVSTTALEEQSGILGTWHYYGYYDPMKWGFKVNQTQLIPDEKIDKTDDSFTITLLENALDDGGEETYSLKYSPDGKTATVDTDMFWQFVLVDENQLLEFNGDATFIYVR